MATDLDTNSIEIKILDHSKLTEDSITSLWMDSLDEVVIETHGMGLVQLRNTKYEQSNVTSHPAGFENVIEFCWYTDSETIITAIDRYDRTTSRNLSKGFYKIFLNQMPKFCFHHGIQMTVSKKQ